LLRENEKLEMRKKKRLASDFLILFLLLLSANAFATPLKVVASTPDLAAMARELGGADVNVQSLCPANQDPHSFEILPQHVIAVRHADVYLKVGAGLDYWSDELLRSTENAHRIVADCSRGIQLIHDAEEAGHGHDEHALGNPHYWLAPSNIPVMAANVTAALREADPAHADEYVVNLAVFLARFDSARVKWQAVMEQCRGERVVTYHRAWDYFAREYDLQIIGTVESQPGAEPSPTDLALLEKRIRDGQARLLLLEPFESGRYARLLEHDTGIAVVNVAPSVGGTPQTNTIFLWFDFLTRMISAHCANTSQP
jgi:ABC-type Zn uptake system ZnuABC Zn-binding protein ZnuA